MYLYLMNFRPQKIKWCTLSMTLLFLWMSKPTFGQFKYETLSTAHGLSQGFIWDILQCKDGFLWMTTKAGLNRYDGYTFKVYNHNGFDSHSISHNMTWYLYEDSKGRIWVGSDHGLNIFDKKTERFYRLFHDPKNPNSLSGNLVDEQITEFAEGQFLVNTSHDFFDIVTVSDDFFEDKEGIKIEHVKKPKNSFNQNSSYNEVIFTDHKNRTWYKCNDHLYQFNSKKYTFELLKVGNVAGNQIQKNNDGTVWLNTEFISLLDGNDVHPVFDKPMIELDRKTLLVDDKGRLWKSKSNGRALEIFDISKWEKGKTLDSEKCKTHHDSSFVGIFKMYKDRSGLVWLGTNGYGLRKYSFEHEKFTHVAHNYSIRKVIPTQKGNIFTRVWTKGGNYILDPKGNMLVNNWDNSGGSDNDYFVSKDDYFWLTKVNLETQIKEIQQINHSTNQIKSFAVDFKGIYSNTQYLLEDKNGYIWFGGQGVIGVFDPKSGKNRELMLNKYLYQKLPLSTVVTASYRDNEEQIWIGTQEGFAKIEIKDVFNSEPKISWYTNDPNNKFSLNNKNVSTFLQDPIDDRFLWIGTKGGGLNFMEKSTGKIKHINTDAGLCDNTVYGILSDESGNIWGSTNNGLFCILASQDRKGAFEIRHFTEAAGLQAAEFNTNAYAKLPNGDLAFGGVNGLNIFNPKEILLDSFTPNIFITKLIVGNQIVRNNDKTGILTQAIEFTQSITLNHDQDVFTLEFSSLDYRAPDQIKYRYRLDGIDNEWIESGTRRNVSYSHLPAGTYTFKVQGSNSLGIWNDHVKELNIIILPPWYASWYAYLCYVLILGFGIRAYYKYKIAQSKMAAQLQFEQHETHRIKELDKIKTHLYTNITHEFRTPLTVILGMVQHIRKSAHDHLDSGLDMIERNGNNLLRLVNEMLDLSKLEAGKMELHLAQGDVINFIRYIVESFHSIAESQDKKMHYLSSLDNQYAKYDEEKLRQIISNLLSNALKFTSKKGDIYVSTALDHENNLCIKVKDTGKGIPESQLHHIFDRFYQADSTHTRHAEGTGIGLALTKELVQLMDGEISVKSPPVGSKVGTEFTVILPLEFIQEYIESTEIKTEREVQVQNTNDVHPFTHLNIQNQTHSGKELILLVEDNADVVAYTASCLQEYRLAVGRDGQEGYDIACNLIPDLIITDVMMPFVDGYEMTKKLRDDMRTSHIPIIMLTAKADIDSKLEGIEYGAEVYIEKPFNVDELTLRVRKLLEQRAILQRAYAAQMGLLQHPKPLEHPETEISQYQDMVIPKMENEFVKKVTAEIEAHLSDEAFSVEQLAKNLFMSYSQVQRKLNAVIGMSPNQYIRVLRLEKSKQLLSTTDETILNISMMCGFSDPSYFGKVFKQEFGKSPQEWRQH
jgi:signal transduction histidine kinase/DNA-binding response OmpR family regulator/ligand-binding sensor domain-containing protein